MKEYEKYTVAMKIYSCLEHEDTVGNFTPFDYQKARLALKKLVDRATPKKANKNTDWYECPNCLADLFPLDITDEEIREIERVVCFQYSKNVLRYCPFCGQALDWSDEL